MQQQPHPPQRSGAANSDVMAAIAAAMAAEEQAAATKAVQQRQQQASAPQPGQAPPAQAQAFPQAFATPQAQAFTAPQAAAPAPGFAAPQPVAQAQPTAPTAVAADPFSTTAPPQQAAPADPSDPFATAAGQTERQILSKEEFDAMLEESHEIKNKKKRKQSIAINLSLCCLPLMAAAAGFLWYKTDEQNQIATQQFVENLKMVGKGEEIGSITDIVDTYDQALDKVAVRRDQVRDATLALGLTEEQIDEILAESTDAEAFDDAMQEMMGGEGITVAERNRRLKEKFGHLAREGEGQATVTGTNGTATNPGTDPAAKPAPPTNNGPLDPIVIPVSR